MKNLLKQAIAIQHRALPMPFFAFDLLFRAKFLRRYLGFYGQICFSTAYNGSRISIGNQNYWESREALYWHYWRQTDTTPEVLKKLATMIPILKDCDARAIELGFGIGKNRYFHPELFPFKKYIGIEPNRFCVEVAKNRMDDVDVYCRNNNDITSLDANVLFAFGGVFMYQNSDEIRDIFSKIRDYEAIIILDEGCDDDLHRSDMTIMHDFKKLLDQSAFKYNHLFKENQKNSNLYSCFAAWK